MQSTITAHGSYRIKRYKSLPIPKQLKVWMLRKGYLERHLLSVSPVIHNTISTANNHGLNIIAQRLAGKTTYDIVIDEGKIGTGTTAPTTADTDIETLTLDNILVANQSSSGGTAVLTFFINDGELANGTYTEFAMFSGGQLFARSLISPNHTKATGEDTSIEYTISFSNA